jgi:hypothetical protein
MIAIRLLMVGCFFFASTCVTLGKDKTKKKEELVWAKEVVTDFLNAGLHFNYLSAATLVTNDFKTALKEGNGSLDVVLRDSLVNTGALSWTITSEMISPTKDEALFRGTLRSKTAESTFSIRVTKDKETQKWRINFFSSSPFKSRTETPKK